jgi:hypothetical protein
MVTLGVEALALLETTIGAKFNAETASLASVFDNPNDSVGNGVGLGIKR